MVVSFFIINDELNWCDMSKFCNKVARVHDREISNNHTKHMPMNKVRPFSDDVEKLKVDWYEK